MLLFVNSHHSAGQCFRKRQVSGVPKRKLKNDEQRLGPEKRPSHTRRPRIDAQRLRHASLSRRNVGGTRAPGNDTAETGLFGWGGRIRTARWPLPRPPIYKCVKACSPV